MLPASDLGEALLSPTSERVASRALARSAALSDRMDIDPLTLSFRSAERERAFALFRAELVSRALRGTLLWLACAYVLLEVSLEAWQHYTRRRIAHYAWAFALVAACALVSAFYLSQGRRLHGDLLGCALLVALAGALIGRAAYAHIDPLAPPVTLSLLFFLGAGPPLLRLRFVAMAAAFAATAGAHACALLLQRTRAKYFVWYELGALLVGLVSAHTCRALECEQRIRFVALASAAGWLGGTAGAEGGAGVEEADGWGGAGGAEGGGADGPSNPLDEALRELRELAHRVQRLLPPMSAHVPTDVVERALGEAGASSLAELLLRHGAAGAAGAQPGARAGGPAGAAAAAGPRVGGGEGAAMAAGRSHGYAPPSLDGTAPAPAAEEAPAAAAAGADGAPTAAPTTWAAVAAARAAGGPVELVVCSALPGYYTPYAWVITGYRCELSAAQCARSLLQWHNETLNVWTELVPAALFAVAIDRFLRDDAVLAMAQVDRLLVTIGLLVALVLRPLCSAAAHLFYCAADSRWYALWWSVDYVSICAAILAVSLVCARNAFFCEPELAHLFFVCSSGLLCTSMIAVLFSASSSVRACSFLLFVLFCNVVPLCYQLFSKLGGWYHNDAPWLYIHYWVASLGTFLLGLVIKSCALPEACAPGRFDLVGSSHQLWHVCINVAFVFGTLLPWRVYADWRAGVPCPAPPEPALPPPSSPPMMGWYY